VGEDCIHFEVLGLDKGHVPPDYDKIAYVASHCRNVTYVWVRLSPTATDWDTLIELLRKAPVDVKKITRFRKASLDLPIKTLERAAGL